MKSRIFLVAMFMFVATLIVFEGGYAQCCGGDKAKTKSEATSCSACTKDAACAACADKVKTGEVGAVTPQTKCPVMGGDVVKEVFADYKGKRVYFCCQPCVDKFKENPEKYLKKLKDEGVKLEKTPKNT